MSLRGRHDSKEETREEAAVIHVLGDDSNFIQESVKRDGDN